MRKTTHYTRTSAFPAIAAALALTSTTALAQQAQPVPTDPVPPAAAEPAPTVEAPPVTDETSTPPSDSPAPATEPSTTTKATTVKRSVRTATVKPATSTRTPALRPHAEAATAAPEPRASAVRPVESHPATDPVVDVNAKPAPAPTPAAIKPDSSDNGIPIAAGGALALLALGGAAVAMNRRRRAHAEEWVDEEAVYEEPRQMAVAEEPQPEPKFAEAQPAIVAPAPSAFAWGNGQPAVASPSTADPDDDRMPGETWVQRAYRGPSANNPSASLRNRIRRAAFFDKRERDVLAGVAEPVDMDAGLPGAMVDEREREFA